jgi:hypothetical protein
MVANTENWQTGKPEVISSREMLEITNDFTDPKDAIREAISNSVDWGATVIEIKAWEDPRAEDELVIEIRDNGVGLNEKRMRAFFNLGDSTERSPAQQRLGPRTGDKGHGTKTYFNSKNIEVESQSKECYVIAVMETPYRKLRNGKVPPYKYLLDGPSNKETYTKVTIRGYNNNQKRDFDHELLRDHILWFTKFGSVEKEFDISVNAERKLYLQGLGQEAPELVEFGHVFPPENYDTEDRDDEPDNWTERYVRRWIFEEVPVRGHPGVTFDLLISLEGNTAKRQINPMIRGRGRRWREHEGMYSVEERYGLYPCKDFIPIPKRYNEWLTPGRAEWTKFHAFVNCQKFRLTANRGDIGNTPPDLLEAIGATVTKVFEEDVRNTPAYRDYEDYVQWIEQYRSAREERNDFNRRRTLALQKKVSTLQLGTLSQPTVMELHEPRQEMGVVGLFYTVAALRPDLFTFRIVDYDGKKGYDAIAARRVVADLTKDAMFFVEFKHTLTSKFSHAFAHLTAIICWECHRALSDGSEVEDITGSTRELTITPPGPGNDHTTYTLRSRLPNGGIEVFVLKDFLREKLGLEFRTRAGPSASRRRTR